MVLNHTLIVLVLFVSFCWISYV